MVATATNHNPAGNPLAGYVPVRPTTLHAVGRFAADLFVQYDHLQPPMLYCRAGAKLDTEHLCELQRAGVEQVYVRQGEFYEFSDDLHQSLDAILQQE